MNLNCSLITQNIYLQFIRNQKLVNILPLTNAQRPVRGYFNCCTMWAGVFEKEFVTLTV
jgi:hypothetical protein